MTAELVFMKCIFLTKGFCRDVLGFIIDCPCGLWWINHFPTAYFFMFWKPSFKRQLVWNFVIAEIFFVIFAFVYAFFDKYFNDIFRKINTSFLFALFARFGYYFSLSKYPFTHFDRRHSLDSF